MDETPPVGAVVNDSEVSVPAVVPDLLLCHEPTFLDEHAHMGFPLPGGIGGEIEMEG